jgi:DNA-binding transcriptional MerR regulator
MGRSKSSSKRRGGRRKAAQDDLNLGTDKLYFKIGEVAEIVGVEAYVLRYWETEFRALRPQKSRSKQRVYRRKDVETVLKIKHLLYERRFTIAGARQEFEKGRDKIEAAPPAQGYTARQSLGPVREQIEALWAVLREDDQTTLSAADPAEYIRNGGGQGSFLTPAEDVGSLAARPDRDTR